VQSVCITASERGYVKQSISFIF